MLKRKRKYNKTTRRLHCIKETGSCLISCVLFRLKRFYYGHSFSVSPLTLFPRIQTWSN